jgi:HSP20 family protein
MFDLMPWRRRMGKDLVGFKSEMDNLFSRFFDVDFPLSHELFKEGQWAPRVDISEGERDITVKAEIPGCDAKDIEVSLEGRLLTIKGEKKQEREEKEKNYLRVERAHGIFSRTMELPTEVDESEVDASYKKGILKVVLRKTKPSETRKIEIRT